VNTALQYYDSELKWTLCDCQPGSIYSVDMLDRRMIHLTEWDSEILLCYSEQHEIENLKFLEFSI
jgi:hypothetical protein